MTLPRLVPGAELKPWDGDPRLTTIAVRALDPHEEEEQRFAVLAVEHAAQYVVWTLTIYAGSPDGNTTNGTYVRFDEGEEERAFLRALGDWLCRF